MVKIGMMLAHCLEWRRMLCGVCVLIAYGSLASEHHYRKQPGVAGQITSVGSDTLANLMAHWSQDFLTLYPHVKFQIQASGSGTAPPALTEGTADIGPMSRELKAEETQYFLRKHGYKPLMVKVAVDAIALYVASDNPLTGLTLAQLDAIFSATRYCGAPTSINNWRQLSPSNAPSTIRTYGRNSVSGTYSLFRQVALCNGDYKAGVKEMPGSAAIVQAVAFDKAAIGYGAFGDYSARVKALAIGTSQQTLVPVSTRNIASGAYPLTRYLYMMINKKPGEKLPELVYQFMRFVLSTRGQTLVQQTGYVAVPEEVVLRQLRQIRRVK